MKSEIFDKLKAVGFIPEYAVNSCDDAVFLASSLTKGNLPVLTLKGEGAFEAFDAIRKAELQCLVGISSLSDKNSIEKAAAAGFQYIVLNSSERELLEYCAAHEYAVIPGVSGATDIARAQSLGFEMVNYYPCSINDLVTLKVLTYDFSSMFFMISGGTDRAVAYKALLNPKVAAVTGSFMIDEHAVSERNDAAVSSFAENTVLAYLNFHVAHMGMNADSRDESVAMASRLAKVLHRPVREGKKSAFAGKLFEIMYSPFYYEKGHIALGSYDATRAYHYLKRCGVEFIEDSLSYDADGRVIAGYMKENFGGFGIHLLQVAPDFWTAL